MFTFIVILSVISTFIRYKRKMNLEENVVHETSDKLIEESTWSPNTLYSNFLNLYTIPLAQFIISWLYKIYTRLTFINVVVFLLKYVSPTIYIYTFLKSLYMAPRERLKEKQMELEDIQLQIHIVHTKLCVRDAEFSERQKHLRHSAERLRRVRARVREIIDGDEALQRAFESFKLADVDHDLGHSLPKEERDFILSTFKKLKCDQVAIPEPLLGNTECSETPKKPDNDDATNPLFKENECRLKIIKVTNVYKVAYLKHYIKQKRLRRANRQMLLKKKMESVKQLLDEWQKALNMVINSKLSILNIERHLDGVSQEAMGDYTKPYEVSDSDSDLRNSSSDPCYDDYNLSWVQNPYRPYAAYHEDIHENDVTQNYDYHEDMKYPSQYDEMCHRCANMVSIIEETNSQMAIEEVKNDEDCGDGIESEK